MSAPLPQSPHGQDGQVIARCEACEAVYELDARDVSDPRPDFDCPDCGGPVYVLVDTADLVAMVEGCLACRATGVDCEYHRGFGDGWDAYAALIARFVGVEREADFVEASDL